MKKRINEALSDIEAGVMEAKKLYEDIEISCGNVIINDLACVYLEINGGEELLYKFEASLDIYRISRGNILNDIAYICK